MGSSFALLMGIGLAISLGLLFLCIRELVKSFRAGRRTAGIFITIVLVVAILILLSSGACFGFFFFGGLNF